MADSLVADETRIRDADGFCGTVVYIGPVASAKNPEEIYAGIKWDDKSRGKHDGTVICRRTNELVRHFSCGPTQGSFLRLNKMDRGIALTASLLKTKYVDMDAPIIAPNNLLPHTARTSSGRPKPIEFLGEMKIRERQQLADIDTISLRREGISRASDDEMPKDFSHIKDIDLAGNLLSSWTEILKVMKRFPMLEVFNVAYNRIRDIGLPVEHFDRMKVLNLNSCSLGSKTLQWVGESMPYLEKLCIANSDLSDLQSIHVCGMKYLQSLDCSNCQLDSWENKVDHFSALPCLEQLSLDENPLSLIPCTPKSEDYFPCLNSLQLAGTHFETWMDLEGINTHFASIKSLRLRNTPLTAPMGQGETRFLAVARFPSLDYFNASVISRSEQQEAERRYVSLVSNMLSKLDEEGNREKLLAEHPQYPKLSEEHKRLVVTISGGVNGTGTNIAASVCNVTIRSMSASSCDMEPILRRLPDSLSVGRLKALCARIFGLGVDIMSLHFRTTVSHLLCSLLPSLWDIDSNSAIPI